MHAADFDFARDFLYLAGILLGAAIGLFFNFYKKKLNFGQKERRITAGFWLLSFAGIGAAAAFILSGGNILHDRDVLIISGCMMAAGIFAALFPESFLFPLIVLSGVCAVFIAFVFLRYPQLSGSIPVTRLFLDSPNTISIEPIYPKFKLTNSLSGASPQARYKNYYNSARPFTMECAAAVVTVNPVIPVIGGQRRCILTALNLVDDRLPRLKLYVPSSFEEAFTSSPLLYGASLVNTRSCFAEIKLNGLEPYTAYTICLDGKTVDRSVDPEDGGLSGKALYRLMIK
ncbi:MAG: hypothetical protein LBP37_05310 [Spirochaetaceae bacterium]|nr:hypothetical protein [Spirochaetaceae bacterium]